MIFWALVIAALGLLEVIAIAFSLPAEHVYPVALLIILVAVALLYRTHIKVEAALKEKLELEIDELRQELRSRTPESPNSEAD